MEAVAVGAGAGVFSVNVGDGEEVLGLEANHAFGHACAELEDLAADVPQEGIRGPAPDEHDGKNGDTSEVHGHGSPRPKGVSSDVGVGETEDIFADALGCRLEHRGDEGGRDELALVVEDDSADGAVLIAAGVADDTLHHLGPHADGAEDVEGGCMLVDGLVLDVRLLEFEGDGDSGGGLQVAVCQFQDPIVFEEPEVPKCEGLCPPWPRDMGVLTGAHGKEEGPDG